MIEACTSDGDIICDFFAGSATTAHSVFLANLKQEVSRPFIIVQLPEEVDSSQATGKRKKLLQRTEKFLDKIGKSRNIAEISKERIRRAGKQVVSGSGVKGWNKDIGFRVLKTDTSNMADVYYTPNQTKQTDLLDHVENIKPDRNNPEDLLFQVMLDWAVDLSLPIRKENIDGKTVFFVNTAPYDLIACFDNGVSEELVRTLAGYEPLRVVFKDNGFVSDAVKINVEQIFKQLSSCTDIKLSLIHI